MEHLKTYYIYPETRIFKGSQPPIEISAELETYLIRKGVALDASEYPMGAIDSLIMEQIFPHAPLIFITALFSR